MLIIGVATLAFAPTAVSAELAAPEPAPFSVERPAFPVWRYEVKGNTLLDRTRLESLLAPYTGQARGADDIQQARQELEQAYSQAGYNLVRVVVPPQDITEGVVTMLVSEFKLGQVTVSGNRHHDEANILAALPSLTPGEAPDVVALAENLRLANENPSRRLDVALALGSQNGTMDAKVKVQDESPQKFSLVVDNTGNASTGRYRTGVAFQHNNLFNHDHAATLSYTTSPDHLEDVTQLSASFRVPLYQWGDSLDFIAGYSDVDAGTTTTVAGPISFSGKGRIYGGRYNHYFPRMAAYTSRLTGGFDYRAYDNTCKVGDFAAEACGSAAADITVHPLSLTYSGAWSNSSLVADFSTAVSHNFSGGSKGRDDDFAAARPSPLGRGGAQADYTVYQLNGSILKMLPQGWRVRGAVRSQLANEALVSGEQFGLAGANSVRGFKEREVARDKGYMVNAELHTPDLAAQLGLRESGLRLVLFVDHAQGWNEALAAEGDAKERLASAGIGLRYDWQRNVTARLDWARVTSGAGDSQSGGNRVHLNFVVNY